MNIRDIDSLDGLKVVLEEMDKFIAGIRIQRMARYLLRKMDGYEAVTFEDDKL